MPDITPFIKSHLLDPLKQYPTVIQDTMVEIIAEKLQELYDYTLEFPEIVTPTKSRLDILKTIADQFLFTIREDADIEEQIAILDNILRVYKKRGSVDSIENMWKYYGGTLPKDVKVFIPSYNMFRYSISKLSGSHVFQDNKRNRTGVYEIRLMNNTYPIPELKEFLIKELVAAGNYIYFTNSVHSTLLSTQTDTNPHKYVVEKSTLLDIQNKVYCTPPQSTMNIASNLYDSQGNLVTVQYPGYFILSVSLLGGLISGAQSGFILSVSKLGEGVL